MQFCELFCVYDGTVLIILLSCSMNRFFGAALSVVFVFFLQFIDIQAQNFQKQINVTWNQTLIFEQENGDKKELLYFDGAIGSPDFPQLPMYFERMPVSTYFEDYDVTVSGERYEKMSSYEEALIPSDFQAHQLSVSVKTVVEKKQNYAVLTFVPIRKTRAGGYEKLMDVTISISPRLSTKGTKADRTYAAQSVLASGSWYKVGVAQTGMFKVTYEDLVAMGASGSQLSSSLISIFGNGGGMLPESNDAPRYDDLCELPILIVDGNDQVFNAGDYFVFYAQGPHSWTYSQNSHRFNHQYNIYNDYTYYFINLDPGVGIKKRITVLDNSALAPAQTVNTFTHYGYHEVDILNIGEAGRCWLGDAYDATTVRSYSFALPPSTGQQAVLNLSVAAQSARVSNFTVALNNATLGVASIPALSGANMVESETRDFTFIPNSTTMNITLTYSKPTTSSVGYLNYMEWQMQGQLQMYASQFPFCNVELVLNSDVARYVIADASNNVRVWDVTNPTSPVQMQGDLLGNTFAFNAVSDSMRRFVAFNGAAFYSVNRVGRVENQNLHATSQVDMIIVTYPEFNSQAERLAAFRAEKDGLSVKIVTPAQIYNEFSSGAQDVTAIRDYMKMIYDKSGGVYPRYLLLFGRPSYDYRGRENTCKLYVPNYQTSSAVNESSLRSNDDYFALLDDNEGENCVGFLDISVGRFPVTTLAQSQIAVNKSINYSATEILGEDHPLTSNFGDWKNVATFVADDEDGTTHIRAADLAATLAGQNNPNINLDKIYLDAYQQVTYSASQRYPEAAAAINHRMNAGCLLFAYVGHGGKNGWATERIVELTDIKKWSNRYNQPWMITLTCEFGWYDRSLISPAELVFLNANGGAAGLVTTSRVAFTGSNQQYATAFYSNIFMEDNGTPKTIGEINRVAKNSAGGAANTLNMIYVMGDPSMRLAMPRYHVVTDSVNGKAVADGIDTLQALSRVTIVGHIADDFGNILSDFSGGLYPSIFDKKVINNTLQNDVGSSYFEFEVQKNILFKGNVTVKNGQFRFSFIIPKDINYSYGKGKFSYYAYSRTAEAAGAFGDAVIGSMSNESFNDVKGPDIELFMNDENFVSGGTVNQSPTLIVKLKDEYGINTTGNGIGHDLVAIMDDNTQIILNNHYEAARDSFNCGQVRYPYEKLKVGTHKIKVRAWDILNNVSEQTIEFTVASDEALTIDHVLNYPNPFTTQTAFYFEHNQPGVMLDVMISIYTISGKLVKTIETSELSDGYRSSPIPWDARDDFGDKLAKGTYIYRLKVRTPNQQSAEKIEKIVIL